MQLDLDKIIDEQLLPWEFSITVGGATYATRPLVVADVGTLQQLVANSDKAVDRLASAVAGLFVAPGPDASTWRMEALLGVIQAVLAYWQSSAEKNSRSLSAIVGAEMGKLLTPGDSTRPSGK
jgi:hypothetical protein